MNDYLLVIFIAAVAIGVCTIVMYIGDAFHEKRCNRYLVMMDYAMPKACNQITEMSIETIQKINDNIYKQYCQGEES